MFSTEDFPDRLVWRGEFLLMSATIIREWQEESAAIGGVYEW
jgi:hypothetical protein